MTSANRRRAAIACMLKAMPTDHMDRLLESVRAAATENPSDPQLLIHNAFSAIIRGDFDTFGESLSDDAELSIVGFGPIDGTWKGRQEVVVATRRNFATLGQQEPEIEGMISQGTSAAILMRESGVLKSNGQAYSVRGVQWFRFENGKIKRIDEIVASIWKTG